MKAFTVAEANALIPTLESVLAEIADRMDRVQRRAERLHVLDLLWGDRVLSPDHVDHAEAQECRLDIAALMGEIEEMVQREITARGIRFPPGGLEHGLIDFPTIYDGRWVFLCWRRGEREVEFWHEIEAGYAGRQELTFEQIHRMGMDEGPAEPPWNG